MLDPDFSLAWVGQAIVATLNGHEQEAMALFEHVVGMSVPVVRPEPFSIMYVLMLS